MTKIEEWGAAPSGKPAAAGRAAGLRARRGVTQGDLQPALAKGEEKRLENLGGFLKGPNAESHKKALRRVYKTLTETPADETGMVEDTPFTKTGVKAFVEQLRKNATNTDKPGGKASRMILKFFTSEKEKAEGAEKAVERVHGVDVMRLQQLSRLATGLMQRRGR